MVARLGWQIGEQPGSNNMIDFLTNAMKKDGVVKASRKWKPATSLSDTAEALAWLLDEAGAGRFRGVAMVDGNRAGHSFHDIVRALSTKHGGRSRSRPMTRSCAISGCWMSGCRSGRLGSWGCEGEEQQEHGLPFGSTRGTRSCWKVQGPSSVRVLNPHASTFSREGRRAMRRWLPVVAPVSDRCLCDLFRGSVVHAPVGDRCHLKATLRGSLVGEGGGGGEAALVA